MVAPGYHPKPKRSHTRGAGGTKPSLVPGSTLGGRLDAQRKTREANAVRAGMRKGGYKQTGKVRVVQNRLPTR